MIYNILFRNLLGVRSVPHADSEPYIIATCDWIAAAQNAGKDGGIPAFYHLRHGYANSYPETTGYILSSVLECEDTFPQLKNRINVEKAVAWLLSLQHAGGGFGHLRNYRDPMVFDTGQIVEGLLAMYRRWPSNKLHSAIVRAVDWLMTQRVDNGGWGERGVVNKSYCYSARVSQIVAEAALILGREDYLEAAKQSVEAVLVQQKPNGWFSSAGNICSEDQPITHFIAYTIEGVLLTGLRMDCKRFVQAAILSMESVNREFVRQGDFLPVTLDSDWSGIGRSACLTGMSQFAVINFHLFSYTGAKVYFDLGVRMNQLVKSTIRLDHADPAVRGGVQSCYPFSRRYYGFCYLNWAAKFHLDALLLETRLK